MDLSLLSFLSYIAEVVPSKEGGIASAVNPWIPTLGGLIGVAITAYLGYRNNKPKNENDQFKVFMTESSEFREEMRRERETVKAELKEAKARVESLQFELKSCQVRLTTCNEELEEYQTLLTESKAELQATKNSIK